MSIVFGHIDEMSDGIYHVIKIFIDLVLPKPEDNPTFFYIMSCDVSISLDVTSNLLAPEFGVRLRQFEVKGTAMPITRVQKDDDV